MFKTKRNIVLALALCALLVPMIVIAKDKVERPMKLHAVQRLIIDLRYAPICPWWIESEVGEATHFGLYTCSGGGLIDLSTGQLTGSGDETAANGDQVFWKIEGPPYVLTYTSGTGRFEDASGSVTLTITPESAVPDPEQPWLLIVTQSFSGIGTIMY